MEKEQRRRTTSRETFPLKLFRLLETHKHKDIISWQPNGSSFKIHDKKRFERDVLSYFFHQTKYASFQRQLNIYGFSCRRSGANRGAYFHKYFLPGRLDLCLEIVRFVKQKDEPNFYSMPNVNPDRPESAQSNIYTDDSNSISIRDFNQLSKNDADLSKRALSIQTDNAYHFSQHNYPAGSSSSSSPIYDDSLQSNHLVESSNASSQNMQTNVEDMSIVPTISTNTSEKLPFYNSMSFASQLQQEMTKKFHLEQSSQNDLSALTPFIHQETTKSKDSGNQASKSCVLQNHASTFQMYDRESSLSSSEPIDTELRASGSVRSFALPRQVSDVGSALSSLGPVDLHSLQERLLQNTDMQRQVANTENAIPSIELLDFHLLPERGFDMKNLFD